MVEAEVRLTRENRVSTDVFMTALVLISLRLSHRFYTIVSDIIFQTFFVLVVVRRSLVVRCSYLVLSRVTYDVTYPNSDFDSLP